MRDEVHDAPSGIRRMSIKVGDTVYVWVGDQVDEMTRERYIQEKRRLNRVKRRRGLLPLPIFGEHTAGQGVSGNTTATVIGTGAIAVGIAAAAILPAALDDNQGSTVRRPPAAAPAPSRPGPPADQRPPAVPTRKPPKQSQAPRETLPGISPVRVRLRLPVRGVHVSVPPARVPDVPALPPPVSVPPAPKPPPISARRPAPLLAVRLPAVGARVWLRPGLSVHVHAGSLRLRLGQAQPRPGVRP